MNDGVEHVLHCSVQYSGEKLADDGFSHVLSFRNRVKMSPEFRAEDSADE